MTYIKTRERNTGTIRTIDRASMLLYRMKQASVKAKGQVTGSRVEDERNESAYAEEKTLGLTGSSVVLSKDAAIKGFRETRHLKGVIGSKVQKAKATSLKGQNGTLENGDIGKEYGEYIKAGKGTYTIRNDYYDKNPSNTTKAVEKHIKSGRETTNQVIKQAENGEKILKKKYWVKRACKSARYRTEKSGKKILASLKRSLTSSKVLTAGFAIAGSIALISIIVCTFFGSAFYILGDEGNPDYIPDGFEGVGDASIVEVAASQVGNIGGEPYWSWYGFNGRVEWCACFVSWCANKCGYIEDGIIPKFAGVGTGIEWFQERNQWQKRGYMPKPGDIIFFDWEGNGYGSHVGIVEKSDDTYVYSIEGNSGDRCRRRVYFLNSSVIMGYGIPKYPNIIKEGGEMIERPSSSFLLFRKKET